MFEAGEYRRAFPLLEPMAEMGHPGAQFIVGEMHREGVGDLKTSPKLAEDYFRKSAAAGNADAMVELAHILRRPKKIPGSNGVREEYEEAFQLYKRAADLGNPAAMFHVSRLYRRGLGAANQANARRYLRMSHAALTEKAAAGDRVSQYVLGQIYARTRTNKHRAVELFRKSASRNYLPAMRELAYMYLTGKIVDKDVSQYFRLVTEGAETGDDTSMANLGLAYLNGTGVEKDRAAAERWLGRSAEKGQVFAQEKLIGIYAIGIVPGQPDYDRAFAMASKTARQNRVVGMTFLAHFYETGRGAPKNLRDAYLWYEKAAHLGHPFAQQRLGVFLQNGWGARKNHFDAVKWFDRAIKKLKPGLARVEALWRRELSLKSLSEDERLKLADLGHLSDLRSGDGDDSGKRDPRYRQDYFIGSDDRLNKLMTETEQHLPGKSRELRGLVHLTDAERKFSQGEFKEALAYLEKAEADARDLPVLHEMRGIAHFRLGNMAEALKAFSKLIELKPDDPMPRVRRAGVLAKLNTIEAAVQAVEDLRKAFEIDPRDPRLQSIYRSLGFLLES